MKISHSKQQEIWDKEHTTPFVLPQMDSHEISSGVLQFIGWLKEKGLGFSLRGIELGCGKGRNVIGLAKLGFEMSGIDFSPAAIKEAEKRSKEEGIETKTSFKVHDATLKWPFESDSFDFGIDCFATTDIENSKGRKYAADELTRVIKKGGYLFAYLLSPEDEFHKKMTVQSPAKERNSFLHPTTGKFEKTFDMDEILELYDKLKLTENRRLPKVVEFFGKNYNCFHHWVVFKKK